MGVTCFWLEETGTAQVGLRRYSRISGCPEDGGRNYHAAVVMLGTAPIARMDDDGYTCWDTPEFAYPGHDDPRWPAACGCGYAFSATDPLGAFQDWYEPLYRRAGTGEETTLRAAPDGAMWDAWWYPWKGPDGRSVMVMCPGGEQWAIDARASNCTLPDDDVHRCWIRHGEPPRITCDKNGVTCAAGAGSIQAGSYHGFLRNGVFDP